MGRFDSKNDDAAEREYEAKYQEWERAGVQARQAEISERCAVNKSAARRDVQQTRAAEEKAYGELNATAKRLWPNGR